MVKYILCTYEDVGSNPTNPKQILMKKLVINTHFPPVSEKKPLELFLKNTSKQIDKLDVLFQLEASYINKNMINDKSRKFCLITGRQRSHYSKLRLSRIQIRDLINTGVLSGLKKSSW